MFRSDDTGPLAIARQRDRVVTIGIAALTVALILAAAIYLLVVVPRSRSEATERWRHDLELSAAVRESALENWLSDRMADARTIATFPSVVALLRGEPEAGAPGQLAAILAHFAREHSINAILVIGPGGVVASSMPGDVAVDRRCIDLAVRSAKHRLGIVEFRMVHGSPRVVVATPVLGEDSSRGAEGTVLFLIDPQEWLYGLVRLKAASSSSAEAFLVQLEGDSVSYATPLRGRADPPLTLRLPLRSANLAAAAALAGREGFSRFVDYRGAPVLAVTRKLASAPWGLVVKVDEAEVLHEAAARSLPIGVGLVLGALLAGLSVAILARAQGRASREARRKDLERIALLLDATSDAVLFVAREGAILDVNSAAERMYGRTKATLKELHVSELRAIGEEDREWGEIEAVEGEGRHVFRARHARRDGSPFPVEVSSRAAEIDGRAGFVLVVRDISDRIAAESRAREFEQQASALFEAGVIGCLFGDIHGGVFDANDTFLEIIGYSRDELRKGLIRWDSITPVEWLPLDAEKVEEAKRNGRCTPYEKQYVRKDGSIVNVLVGYRLLDPDRERSVAFILDISELKREQRGRRRAESALSAVFETPGLPIVIVDVKDDELVHVDCNAAYAESFGRSIQEVQGRKLSDLGVNRAFIAETIARVRVVAASGMSEVFESDAVGDARRYVISIAPLPGPSPSVARALLVMTDVTSLRVAELELRQLNAELEQRVAARTEELLEVNRELEAFSYSVSHDLRAPLRAIDGFSRIVAEEYGQRLDEEGRRLLKVISRSTRVMGQLIDDLLAFARVGRQPIRRKRVSMAALANGAWLDIPQDQREGVAFQLAALPDASGDAALLRQVWRNLLTNAVKYSAPKSDRRIEVGSRNDDGRTIWFVRDNGVGFDMKHSATLFGVFQRLHSPSEFEGTGVGLAIVQRIVHRHAGEVWGEGEPGAGATFSFTLGE